MFCICGRKGKELWRTRLLRPTTAFHFLSPSHWSKWLSSFHPIPCNSGDCSPHTRQSLKLSRNFTPKLSFLFIRLQCHSSEDHSPNTHRRWKLLNVSCFIWRWSFCFGFLHRVHVVGVAVSAGTESIYPRSFFCNRACWSGLQASPHPLFPLLGLLDYYTLLLYSFHHFIKDLSKQIVRCKLKICILLHLLGNNVSDVWEQHSIPVLFLNELFDPRIRDVSEGQTNISNGCI
jgi:hypothetical protein